jgi:hypothetical protein
MLPKDTVIIVMNVILIKVGSNRLLGVRVMDMDESICYLCRTSVFIFDTLAWLSRAKNII